MAYYLHDLQVEGTELLAIKSCRIEGQMGEHATLILAGYVEEETTIQGGEEISLYLKQEAGNKTLFYGIVIKADLASNSGLKEVEIIAKSYSYVLDLYQYSESFQDTSMKYSKIIHKLMDYYEDADFWNAIEDREIGNLIIQYEETDWEFLKRITSLLGTTVTPASEYKGIRFYAGIPDLAKPKKIAPANRILLIEDKEIPYTILQMQKDLESYYDLKQNNEQVLDTDFIKYQIQSKEIYRMFEKLDIHGQEFIVSNFCYEFLGSELVGTYWLQREAGLKQKAQYPMHLIGAALKGVVVNTSRDKVQVQLDIDKRRAKGNLYWFPYSTLSASPDGSGWYCMPEKYDELRIYFPSKHTGQAIAISAVSEYEESDGSSDKMADPSVKYLSTKHEKELILAPGYIRIDNKGKGSVQISDSGKIDVSSANTVILNAEDTIQISTGGDLKLHAADRIAFQCGAGAAMGLGGPYIVMNGVEVKMD